jgi:hypothetical protein
MIDVVLICAQPGRAHDGLWHQDGGRQAGGQEVHETLFVP